MVRTREATVERRRIFAMRGRAAVWFAAGFVATSAACASTRAARARTDYLTTQLDGLRYAKPLDEVWPEVRRLLADKGYPLAGEDAKAVGQSNGLLSQLLSPFSPAKETRPRSADVGLIQSLVGGKSAAGDVGGRFLETDWKVDQDRYRVDGFEDGSGCRIVFTVITQDHTEHGRDADRRRDLEMELDLARRIDPEAAARIEAGLPAQ